MLAGLYQCQADLCQCFLTNELEHTSIKLHLHNMERITLEESEGSKGSEPTAQQQYAASHQVGVKMH